MQAIDFVIVAVVAVIIGLAALYIIKAKKSGKKCIGCPVNCSSGCSGSCSSRTGCSGYKK